MMTPKSEISRAAFIEWRNSPCTVAMMSNLDDNCKMLMNTWAGNGFQVPDSVEGTAMKNAGALGVIEALKGTLQVMQSGAFVQLTDELGEVING